jgi:hypothetical protein
MPPKPILAWVPSQKGFRDEFPQRQSANVPRAGTSSPRESHTRHVPATRYGPFFSTSIVILAVAVCVAIGPDVSIKGKRG